ncbi:MAG: Crp/Fnr family transcriptional regulator [Nitrospirae bacterium]|nr:MAG: Crp/Fnr family transcriptional regulator [Nitrospirota bacterium]
MDKNSNIKFIEQLIKNISIFKNLSTAHIARVIESFSFEKVRKGDVIFNQSDKSTDFYIVVAGNVRAVLHNEEGHELVLAIFGAGEFFGEMSLLDGNLRSAAIVASEDSVVAVLKRSDFLELIHKYPMIAVDMLSALVQRLRMTDDMLGSIAFLDVSHRTLRLFQQIAKSGCEVDKKTGFYKIGKITQKEIAARTGASREGVAKAMRILAFKGVLREDDGFFFISPEAENL